MRRYLLLLAVCAAALGIVSPSSARPLAQCGLPSSSPWWIDFGDGSVPFWELFAKPGNIVAASNVYYPPRIREAGASTVYFDLYLNNRVGTPSAPKDPSTLADRAARLFDLAVRSSGCDQPIIALNELFGANLPTPWSATNVQYRANVLTFVKELAGRGARPFLLISARPFTSGAARDWWLEAAQYADLVPEVYFNAPALHKQGPIVGNRRLRIAMRNAISSFTSIGIPPSKLGVVLGFQTARGAGGREGLQPREAWFEVVKWQALAVRQIATETRIASIWSWGWASWSEATRDPDKEPAACVYLWVRNPVLCDGPGVAGDAFDPSLTEGQLNLSPGKQCTFGPASIGSGQLAGLQRLTGDREVAFTTLLARTAEAGRSPISPARVLAAERAVVALQFRGSPGAYRAELAAANANVAIARGVLADELRRLAIEALLPPRPARASEVSAFYDAYPDLLTRRVEADPAPWWLGGRKQGLAFASLAPEAVFRLPQNRLTTVRAVEGSYRVQALGEIQPLASIPFTEARPAVAAVLGAFGRRAEFERWTLSRQTALLSTAICRRDELPTEGTVRLAAYLPFLALSAAS